MSRSTNVARQASLSTQHYIGVTCTVRRGNGSENEFWTKITICISEFLCRRVESVSTLGTNLWEEILYAVLVDATRHRKARGQPTTRSACMANTALMSWRSPSKHGGLLPPTTLHSLHNSLSWIMRSNCCWLSAVSGAAAFPLKPRTLSVSNTSFTCLSKSAVIQASARSVPSDACMFIPA